MELFLFGGALAIAFAMLVWFSTDKVLYRGAATIQPNNMPHYSTTHKTVFVVPHQTIPGHGILIATVSNREHKFLFPTKFAMPQQNIVVRKRLGGEVRVHFVS